MSHRHGIVIARRFFLLTVPVILAFLAAITLQEEGAAQGPPSPAPAPESAPATMLQGGLIGELLSIYPPRDPDEVRRLLDSARSFRQSAENEVTQSRTLAEAADGRVRIMDEELKTTKTRLDVAKNMKNEVDRGRLEKDARQQDSEKKYLVRLRDVLKADADRLDSDREAADARVKALELEVDMAAAQSQLSLANPATESDISSYKNVLEQMLKAQKTAAELGMMASDKRKQVADRRLKQLDALSKLSSKVASR
jgi:hypothetical protein